MKIEKLEKFAADLHDKIYYIHKKFKTSIKSWISIEESDGVIEFKQKSRLKPYTGISTELKKSQK